MTARTTLLASWILIVTGALAGCGDDEPAGTGGGGTSGRDGSGGGASGTTGPGATSPTTSSSQATGGSGQGGGDAIGGGGAGGDGGGGGADAAAPTVEIALQAAPADGDRSVVQVLVNDAHGALVERLYGDELPVHRELEDGWTVTWLSANQWGSYLWSHRVTPEVDRIEGAVNIPEAFDQSPCTHGAPMRLTFVVPDVPGAAEIRIETSVVPHTTLVEPGTSTVAVIACEGQESLVALAVARDASHQVVALETIAPIPYVPGGTSSHALTMPPPIRTTLAVDLGDLDGATSARADTMWRVPASRGYWGLIIHEPHHVLDVQAPSPATTYAPSVLAPGFGVRDLWAVVATSHGDGWCSTRRLDHGGGFGGPTALALGSLRRPVPVDDAATTWAWDGAGTVGDALTRTWTFPATIGTYPDPPRTILWTLADDPRVSPRTAVFPELPGDLPPGFERPESEPTLHSIDHEDDEATEAYADVVREVSWQHVHTKRSRSTRPCP